ncbi:unknown [Clostridium sp. CAG:411]|nr:unknown [Clostridium sp. CAG:411]
MTLSFLVAIVITCEKREKNGKNYTKRKTSTKSS